MRKKSDSGAGGEHGRKVVFVDREVQDHVVSVGEGLHRIETLLASGDHLAAFDVATDPHFESVTGPDRIRLGYLRALALARSGATSRAEDELSQIDDLADGVESRLAEDIAALRGRLHKDRALRSRGKARTDHFRRSATSYSEAFERHGGPFSGVNAASMWLLAGEPQMAQSLARKVLVELGPGPDDSYWNAVTRAEAHLVLGDIGSVIEHLAIATTHGGGDAGARATTLRQMKLLCTALGVDASNIVEYLANPSVVHFCGHRFVSEDDQVVDSEGRKVSIVRAVSNLLEAKNTGHAYGSLAAGADIIIAEAALALNIELHILLPFSLEEFIDISVRSSGDQWVERFQRVLEAATSVSVTCDSGYGGDDSLFAYASAVGMGRARILAGALEAEAWQLAIWDGESTNFEAGTALDVSVWRQASGASTEVIAVEKRTGSRSSDRAEIQARRPVRALLFGDIQGFSKLFDEDLGPFIDGAMSTIASVIDRYSDVVIDRNTWGDGLFIAFSDVTASARCALDLQEAMTALSQVDDRAVNAMKMRISLHAGPVLSRRDPVRAIDTVFGREITRAARIEPRTPPGEVYVTSAVAALLRLDPSADVTPEYVGRITTAKDFETIPMYVLRRSV